MHMRLRRLLTSTVLVASLACSLVSTSQAPADSAGTVHVVGSADSSFDQYTRNPSPEMQAWLRSHMWRMTVWSPYFDTRTSWYSQGWLYDDAYAIYNGSQLAAAHPEWILHDGGGNKLYIPYGCSGGSCSQYAGDIANPAYRQYWIQAAAASLAHGYRGIFIDDVNMEERVGNGHGSSVAPIDSSTGLPMSAAAWRGHMADFMSEIRAALPGAEIVHNAIWFANSAAGSNDPDIRREIEAADYINLERGFNDPGLTGGNGQWSANTFMSYIDEIHALGKGVIMGGSAHEAHGMEYNLAGYFLVSAGNDAIGGPGQTPASWWSGWNANLGEATDARHPWNGLLRRDFTGGLVLLNLPGESTRTVTLPTSMRDAGGNIVTTVTLASSSGAILSSLESAPISPPASHPPIPTPIPTPVPTPTQTTVHTVAVLTTAKAESRIVPAPTRRGTPTTAPRRTAPSLGHAPRNPLHKRRGRLHMVLAKVSGTVRHVSQGRVTILIEVKHGYRWVLSRRALVNLDRGGHFIRLLHLNPAERYRVLARYAGTPRNRPSHSRFSVVVVRRA